MGKMKRKAIEKANEIVLSNFRIARKDLEEFQENCKSNDTTVSRELREFIREKNAEMRSKHGS